MPNILAAPISKLWEMYGNRSRSDEQAFSIELSKLRSIVVAHSAIVNGCERLEGAAVELEHLQTFVSACQENDSPVVYRDTHCLTSVIHSPGQGECGAVIAVRIVTESSLDHRGRTETISV